ncbi:hypothetical protein JCM8547_001187 [Rhodosporidiobolus lusitaniae]
MLRSPKSKDLAVASASVSSIFFLLDVVLPRHGSHLRNLSLGQKGFIQLLPLRRPVTRAQEAAVMREVAALEGAASLPRGAAKDVVLARVVELCPRVRFLRVDCQPNTFSTETYYRPLEVEEGSSTRKPLALGRLSRDLKVLRNQSAMPDHERLSLSLSPTPIDQSRELVAFLHTVRHLMSLELLGPHTRYEA